MMQRLNFYQSWKEVRNGLQLVIHMFQPVVNPSNSQITRSIVSNRKLDKRFLFNLKGGES